AATTGGADEAQPWGSAQGWGSVAEGSDVGRCAAAGAWCGRRRPSEAHLDFHCQLRLSSVGGVRAFC
ncbi:unnamed protein product, partial [Urochloa humidicola]